jgi:hypothetical protein
MLVVGAVALLIFVVVAIAALLALDLQRTEHRHWLDALKTWQQLIGSVLGFLGAAGVLVLSTAISQETDRVKAANSAHAIGLGLAYEVQAIGVGLKAAQAVGQYDLTLANPGEKCVGYAETLQDVMVTNTPVYAAVLPRMVDFGDANLHDFVTFYALYTNLLRSLPSVIAKDCPDTEHAGDWLAFMVGQVEHIMDYYASIADTYGIANAQTGVPQDASSSAPVSSSASSSSP